GPRGKDRIMGTPLRPKAERGIGEVWVEDRHQHLMYRLLDEPVENRGNAKKAVPATGLGDFNPAHRRWLIPPRQKVFPNARPMRYQMLLQVANAHFVDARRSLVRHHPV